MTTRIKICCICSVAEARAAVDAGCSALGLVAAMPSGPGVIDEATIALIAEGAPPGVATFLLTSENTEDAIVAQHARCRTSTIQICDRLRPGALRRLRQRLCGIKLVQVAHVEDELSLAEAVAAAEEADAILLDSGKPGAAVKELGGTGRVHNWEISAKIRQAIAPKPLYLAGGLRPENIGAAIKAVRPFGVDICSGIRHGGKLDEARLRAFVAAVQLADSVSGGP